MKKILFGLVVVFALGAIVVLAYLIHRTLSPPSLWQSREDERQFQTNFAKWERQKITHYRMQLTIGCFCEPYFDGTMPMIVEVKNDEIVSVVDGKGKVHAPGDAVSIAYLFRYAASALQDSSLSTEVRYDPVLGYPASIGTGPITPIPDAWNSYAVTDVEVLQP